MIKAIFFDVDGTLISGQYPYIQEEVIDALKQLRQQGILLFLATGRHYLELQELKFDEQFIFDGYVLLNGGLVFYHQEVILENCIDENDAKKMCDVIFEKNYPALFIERDDMVINRISPCVIEAQKAIASMIPKVKERFDYRGIYQLDPYVSKEELEDIINDTKTVKVTQWHEYAYDIIPRTGGKKAGIEAIQKRLSLSKQEMMAFGDGDNDIEMFEAVGTCVMMANGSSSLRQYATYVCKDVYHNGIIDGLLHFGLLQKDEDGLDGCQIK